MKKICLLLMLLAMVTSATGQVDKADKERAAKQSELDAACEAARLEELIPLRAQYVEECVEKEQRPDRESCERFYANHGNGAGNRRLFYDLPECVKAFEYSRSGD